MQQVEIIHRSRADPDPLHESKLESLCSQALNEGRISPDEARDIQRADLIARGLIDGMPTQLAAEISIMGRVRDFRRAIRWAGILDRVITPAPHETPPGTVEALVIADNLHPEVNSTDFRARHIHVPFRPEELEEALEDDMETVRLTARDGNPTELRGQGASVPTDRNNIGIPRDESHNQRPGRD